MLKPDYETAKKFAEKYSVLPLYRELQGDSTTPIAILRKLSQKKKRYFLLESVEAQERWGRYSFLGCDPVCRVTCKNGIVKVESKAGTKTERTEKPLHVLREILRDYRTPVFPELPPFTGGLVGYFAYSMIGYAEPVLNIKESAFADFDLMLFDKVMAYDHLKQKIFVIVNVKTSRLEENYETAGKQIEELCQLLQRELPEEKPREPENITFTCNTTEEEYCRTVEKTKAYIHSGDIFQAVISRQFEGTMRQSLFPAYRILRTTNPSPYMVYLHTEEEELMSTSPETLVRLKNGRLVTFPVAGSKGTGRTQYAGGFGQE